MDVRRTTEALGGVPGCNPRGAYSCTRIYHFRSDFCAILLLFAASWRGWWRYCVHNRTYTIAEAKFCGRTFLVALVEVRRTTEAQSGVPGCKPRGAYSCTRIYHFRSDFCSILLLFTASWRVGGAIVYITAPTPSQKQNFATGPF